MSRVIDYEWKAREALLVQRFKETQDPVAFEELYTYYYTKILLHCTKMMGGNTSDGEEMAQDTFVKAYTALPKTSSEHDLNVPAWLHRIASNNCLDVLRRRARRRFQPWDPAYHDPLQTAPPSDEPDRVAQASEATAMVKDVLRHMSERHRWALILREYHALSCNEIGDIFNLSRSAVKSILFRSREEFRRVFHQRHPGYVMTDLPTPGELRPREWDPNKAVRSRRKALS